MSFLDAVILGVVQGLSEFLPISSTGHLVLAEHGFGITADFAFEVFVHLGTLISVIVFFRQRLWEFLLSFAHPSLQSDSRKYVLWLAIGTIPAAVIGVLFKDYFERVFGDPLVSAIQIVITGVILLATALCRRGTRDLNSPRAWWIGCAQAVSILPGISRSGATISAGLFLGVRPERAAEFSFLLSIPAIAGALILTITEVWGTGRIGAPHIIGAVVAGITGYLALRLVFAFLRSGRFAFFGVYCLVIGGIAILLLS